MSKPITSLQRQLQQIVAKQLVDISRNPFVQGIAAGSLPSTAVATYVQQDNLYLQKYLTNYQQVLEILAPDLLATTIHAIDTENRAHQALLAFLQTDNAQLMKGTIIELPTTRAYLQHIQTAITANAWQGLAALLACPLIYTQLAVELQQQQAVVHRNPFAAWIDFYLPKADYFKKRMIELFVNEGQTKSDYQQFHALHRFEASCKYENAFFTQAMEE